MAKFLNWLDGGTKVEETEGPRERRAREQQEQSIWAENRPKLPQPRPKVLEDSKGLSEYEQLAEELGIKPKALAERKIRKFMQELKLPFYDWEEVELYLGSTVPTGMVWEWQILGQVDRDSLEARRQYAAIGIGLGRFSYNGRIDCLSQYTKTVPIHILRRAKAIRDVRPEAKFFVSEVRVPDPFIMTLIPDLGRAIFGVWDEPGFGDLKTEV